MVDSLLSSSEPCWNVSPDLVCGVNIGEGRKCPSLFNPTGIVWLWKLKTLQVNVVQHIFYYIQFSCILATDIHGSFHMFTTHQRNSQLLKLSWSVQVLDFLDKQSVWSAMPEATSCSTVLTMHLLLSSLSRKFFRIIHGSVCRNRQNIPFDDYYSHLVPQSLKQSWTEPLFFIFLCVWTLDTRQSFFK